MGQNKQKEEKEAKEKSEKYIKMQRHTHLQAHKSHENTKPVTLKNMT